MSDSGEIVMEKDTANPTNYDSNVVLREKRSAECVKRNFASQPVICLDDEQFLARKISSAPNTGTEISYDDLCGKWSFPDTPAYQRYDISLFPRIYTWKFIDEIDVFYLKQFQDDKEAVLALIKKKLPDKIIFTGTNKDIFLQLMWEVFRFSRDNGYSEMSISSLLGLFYFTHRYFLTTIWRTAEDTYEFFKESLLLHSVTHPPKSIEVFTPTESKQVLDLFWTIYMRQLSLLRLVCLPNYRLILRLQNVSADYRDKEEEKL